MSKRIQKLFFVVALVSSGGPAGAYMLPGRNVIRKVNGRLNGVHSIQVALVGRARAGDAPDATVAVAERWIFDHRQHGVRVDCNGPASRTAAWSRTQGPSGDASLLPSNAERLVFSRLFADGDLDALARDLGVDTDKERLGLIGERVAIVLGSSGPADGGAEIWIDQEDFTVRRVRWHDQDRQLVELELGDWEGPPTRGVFPQRVRVVTGGRWVRVMEADDLRSQPGS